jgi:hypothetical protein
VDKYGRARLTTNGNLIRRTGFECCVTKAKVTHLEHVKLVDFPWQQWLLERLSVRLIRTLSVLFLYCNNIMSLYGVQMTPERRIAGDWKWSWN